MEGKTRRIRMLAAAAAVVACTATATAPALAQYRPSQPPPAQQALAGAGVPQQHFAAVEAYGGLYQGPMADYVARVGERVAAVAGRRQCGFHVINSDVVNAFTAPPGCHVYVTRGLLSIINSEDELASVLGHEVAHVAANHAGRRQQRSVLSGLGALVVGAITGSGELAQIASQAAQLNVLSYSRNQEYEADALGIRYLAGSGYSPVGLVDMLEALQADDALRDRVRGRQDAKAVPQWARTHPLTADRIARARQNASRAGAGGIPEREEPYFAAIDGLIYGDDPAQGFVEGRTFAHPDLGITFEAPPGFLLTNSPRAVKIEGPNGERGEFVAGRAQGPLEDYAFAVLQRVVGRTPAQAGEPDRVRIHGAEAVILPAMAQTQAGRVEVTVAAYRLDPTTVYHFVTLAPAGRSRVFDPLFGSFRRLDPRQASLVRPRRIQVVAVRPGDTAQTLAQRMAFDDARLERFQMINGLEPGEPLRPGQRVKLVVWDRR